MITMWVVMCKRIILVFIFIKNYKICYVLLVYDMEDLVVDVIVNIIVMCYRWNELIDMLINIHYAMLFSRTPLIFNKD